MSTYFGNYDASYQHQGGYYYQPYVDNGPYAQSLRNAGTVVGGAIGNGIGGALTEGSYSGQIIGNIIGTSSGGSAGEAAGFYRDNFSAMVKNIDTFMQELNDYRSWVMPNPIGD